MRNNTKGFSYISVIVSVGICSLALYALASSSFQSNHLKVSHQKRVLAEAYAAELLETLISNKGQTLLGKFPGLPFCKPINFQKDATSGQWLYPDSRLSLNDSRLDQSNRFFYVQVVDTALNPPAVKQVYCTQLASPTMPVPSNSDRLLVTVGVTYEDPKNRERKQQVILSSLIPDW